MEAFWSFQAGKPHHQGSLEPLIGFVESGSKWKAKLEPYSEEKNLSVLTILK
jgi:hypothetical protein